MITLPPHYGCLSRHNMGNNLGPGWHQVTLSSDPTQAIRGIDCSYNGSIVVILTINKVFRSVNSGATFSELTAFAATGLLASLNDISCNGNGQFISVVGNNTQLYSSNGGSTVTVNTVSGVVVQLNRSRISKTSGSIAVAGDRAALWVSSTLGGVIDASVPAMGALEVAQDCSPSNSSGRYLALSTGGFLRDGSGALVASGVGSRMFTDGMWGGTNSTNIITVGTSAGLKQSLSGGAFTTLTGSPVQVYADVCFNGAGTRILALPGGTTNQMQYSSDSGSSFTSQTVPGGRPWSKSICNFSGSLFLAYAAGQTNTLWVGNL